VIRYVDGHARGVRIAALPGVDPTRRVADVCLDGVMATSCAADASSLREVATILTAAEAVGVAERALEASVAHAKVRQQFGKPIGSFQAVKHHLANVKVALEYARPVVYRAAHSVACRDASRAVHVSQAKIAAGEAAALAARTALQVHGAIGYTWEQDLHVWMRRAWSLELAWGSGSFHRARVAEFVLDPAAEIGPGTTFRGGN
jgi:hypothetical protein